MWAGQASQGLFHLMLSMALGNAVISSQINRIDADGGGRRRLALDLWADVKGEIRTFVILLDDLQTCVV